MLNKAAICAAMCLELLPHQQAFNASNAFVGNVVNCHSFCPSEVAEWGFHNWQGDGSASSLSVEKEKRASIFFDRLNMLNV
jgi:hypothetical protein